MGYIYKIWNELNDKVYIGKTTRTISARWEEHKNHSNDKKQHLYYAMRKYGIIYFHIEEVEQCEDKILNEREKYWIKHFDSYNNGYNMTWGGDGASLTSIEMENRIYELWDAGNGIQQIADIIQLKSTTPIKNRLYEYPSYSIEESLRRGAIAISKSKCKKIYQWTQLGELIAEYDSEIEAEEKTGINRKSISNVICLKRKYTCMGYVWTQENKFPNKLLWQCDLNGNKIQCFVNSGDASKKLGIDASGIRKVVNGKRNCCGGFKWIED